MPICRSGYIFVGKSVKPGWGNVMNKFIKELFNKRKKKIILIFMCVAVSSVLMPYSVSLLTKAIESLETSKFAEAAIFAILYGAVYSAANLLTEMMDYLKRKTVQILQFDLKEELKNRIFFGNYAELLKVDRGDMLSYFAMADEAVFNALYPTFEIVGLSVTLVISSVYVGIIDVRALIAVWIALAFWEIITKLMLKKGKKAAENALNEKKSVSGYISQVIEGKEDIIVWNRENKIFRDLAEKHIKLLKTESRKTFIYTLREELDTLIIAASIVAAFLISGMMQLEPTIIIALYMYINLIFSAVMELNGIIQSKRDGDVNFEEIDSLIAVAKKQVLGCNVPEGNICFKGISVNFGEKTVFNNIDVEIESNKTTALWGRSGSGKTTIINILNGFTEFSGDVFIGNIKISQNGFCSAGHIIALVPQEVILFAGTLAENICLDSEFDIEKMRSVLSVCGLENDGFFAEAVDDVEISEGGTNLSVGQRQRVCIARALYQDRKILVFDEPTYALDDKNVETIRKLLINLNGKKTILLSTHDERLLSVCDRIVDVEKYSEDR